MVRLLGLRRINRRLGPDPPGMDPRYWDYEKAKAERRLMQADDLAEQIPELMPILHAVGHVGDAMHLYRLGIRTFDQAERMVAQLRRAVPAPPPAPSKKGPLKRNLTRR